MTGTTSGKPNSAVTFSNCSDREFLGPITFGSDNKDESCIRLCIFDAPEFKGCSEDDKYEDNDIFAWGETYKNSARMFFETKNNLEIDKTVWISATYLHNGEWRPCGRYYQVKIHQDPPTCENFKRYVTTYTTPFIHTQAGDNTSLNVAHIMNMCGCGRLYVFDNYDNGYSSENINNLPSELQYITGMTEGCIGSDTSYGRAGDAYLYVNPLTKEEAEQLPDGKRMTHMGVCWCDECGTNGNTKLDGNNVCECMVAFDVTEIYQIDCSKYRCSDYDLNLNNSCQSSICRISHAGNEGNPMLIGTYDPPIECFSVEVTCDDTSVKSCTTGVTASGKVGIYIECYPNTKEKEVIINVDINVYKEGSSGECQHGNIQVILEAP